MNTSNISLHTNNEERRRFFRIDDDINLYYKVIDANAVQDASQISTDLLGNCSLSSALDMLTQEAKVIMRRIETRDPEVADYFKVLNNKIDLIAQALMLQGMDFGEQQTRNVNISASGLAFDNEEALKLDDFLEVKMVLSSLAAVIMVHAKVVYCRQNPENQVNKLPYLIGLDYVNIQEQDRKLLIKHIVRRQMQQIRATKESHNPDTSMHTG